MTYDQAASLTANGYTKTGYTFAGWNTQSDGGGTAYTDGQNVTNLTSVEGETVTLFAQWRANSYTIQFDGNTADGGDTANQVMTYDQAASLTVNGYTKTGYTFTGWNTQSDGGGTTYTDEQECRESDICRRRNRYPVCSVARQQLHHPVRRQHRRRRQHARTEHDL